MKVEPLLERLRHCAIARNVRGGAQLHRAVIGDDQDVAGLGDEERAEARVAGDLLQIWTGAAGAARCGAGDPIVRVDAAGDRRDQRRQRRPNEDSILSMRQSFTSARIGG